MNDVAISGEAHVPVVVGHRGLDVDHARELIESLPKSRDLGTNNKKEVVAQISADPSKFLPSPKLEIIGRSVICLVHPMPS